MRFYPASLVPASLMAALLAGAALPATAAILAVPQQFPTIQAAVNAAKSGDTVLISAKPKGGVYNESVTITTPHVTLQGKNNPVIDGTNLPVSATPGPYSSPIYPIGIEIRADYTTVSGLTVQNIAGGYNARGGVGINSGYLSADGTAAFSFSGIAISGVTLTNDYNGIEITGFGTRAADGTVTNPQGFSLLGSTVTGCTGYAVEINGTSGLLVSGNRFLGNAQAGLNIGGGFSLPLANVVVAGNVSKNNGYDGLDVYGTGLLVTANECASNGYYGMIVDTLAQSFFGPPPTTAPAPSNVAFNSVHDNSLYGLKAYGAQTIFGNSFNRNTGYGVYLVGADNVTVSGNSITGTTLSGNYNAYDDGTGLFADDNNSGTSVNPLTISANQISGNTGDGIYLDIITDSTVSYNNVVNNAGVGIHLSDYPSVGQAPNTVTQNRAVHNTLFDARDDSNAADNLTYNGYTSYGDNYAFGASINIYTKNQFGTTDPVGLSK